MILRILRYFFILVFSLLLYQNCGDQPNMDTAPEAGQNPVNKTSIGDADDSRPVTIRPGASPMQLNLNNGAIIQAENSEHIGLCLESERLRDLKNLLDNSSICRTKNEIPPETMCTMIYRFAYIELYVSDSDELQKLGEATSGCPEVTLDLCQNSKALQALINSIDPQVDLVSCP